MGKITGVMSQLLHSQVEMVISIARCHFANEGTR